MAIPPFPSQDLAKLVLGYLAEEQLMTAYDEFLQASPYLDALRNEYDRIFMTSLRNILAEYRAVKIYVETCKPFLLRMKLVQCTNLLEVVKLLMNYIDINKLHSQDTSSDKLGSSKQNTSAGKHNVCEVCTSLNLSSCACKSKQGKLSAHSASHMETSSLENSVETTALEDLPGNQVTTRKKHVRLIEKDSISESNVNISDSTRHENIRQSTIPLNISNSNSQNIHMKCNESSSLSMISSMVKATETPENREKIEEFNNILNKVCNKSNADTRVFCMPEPDILASRPNVGFQDFASEVSGHENKNVPVPDSSTSENTTAQILIKDNSRDISNPINEVPKDVNEHSEIQQSNTYPYPRIKPKDAKIKIISDIKVDSPFGNLNNATSTPLMQTIVINGTPAYKQKLPVNNNYTTDEIMAMPTIIVVPTSGPPQKLTQTQPVLAQKIKKVKTKTVSSANVLGPLVIDVSSPAAADHHSDATNQQKINLPNSGVETGLVKTVEFTKNASVPKDNTIPGSTQTNTPQGVAPLRKSSSTPRRNSHIRVLDFTTPRRILHETIHEKLPEETTDNAVEIVVTTSPNILFTETTNCANNIVNMSAVKVHKIDTSQISKLNENKEIKTVPKKTNNWDANLRALIGTDNPAPVTVKKPRSKKKKVEKPVTESDQKKEIDESKQTKKPSAKRKGSPKGKKSKRKKLEEEEEQYNEAVKANEAKIALKPTFNIVAADLRITQSENLKPVDHQNKSNKKDITEETPEAERISLQNDIGAKLNISDFLETPYKQALYDIQMETPKFLGSVLPDEPISDIKIMNIPTPRFFDTSKPGQATPYASRGTDYSSGGSYYKPDEQDYLRIPDLECPVTSSKQEHNVVLTKQKETIVKTTSRPVRKCTKNVSYRGNNTRSKGIDDKVDCASTCSDSTSISSSFDHSKENLNIPKTLKTPRDNKPSKVHPKSETKKVSYSSTKRKSPMKKDKSNTFMKKPRRPTPSKNNKRSRRNTVVLQNISPKTHVKKRVSGKEKSDQVTPTVTCAPTKSRRKSSAPRKLHRTKQFIFESSSDSPEMNVTKSKLNVSKEPTVIATIQDSDTEQLALRWSDDGSQDAKVRVSECEDISKIKEYIEKSALMKPDYTEAKGTLQVDLIKRGFDAETAKIIERDLLDTPTEMVTNQSYVQITVRHKDVPTVEKNAEINTRVSNELQIVQGAEQEEEEDDDDLELSAYECNEESENFIVCQSDAIDKFPGDPVTLKEAWSMEVCIDDGVPIRLRASNFTSLFDNEPDNVEAGYSFRETEIAVSSISDMDKLYTPLKDRRTQCYEIFDSTLTSLDTPLKLNSPKGKIHEITEIEIVVEEEKVEDKTETKKRKQLQIINSPEESLTDNKKTKPEAQYLFNSTNIQNIDIESVLKKLHGP